MTILYQIMVYVLIIFGTLVIINIIKQGINKLKKHGLNKEFNKIKQDLFFEE